MAKRDYTAKRTSTRANTTKYYTDARSMSAQPKVEQRYRGRGSGENFRQWYDLDEDKVGPALADLIERIDLSNSEMTERFMRFARLYGNYEALGWSTAAAGGFSQQSNNKPVCNIVQSGVDTVHSKVARDNPAPYFITSGADYFEKLKAEKLTQFVQGVFEQANLYDAANNDVFRDGEVYGLGGLQFRTSKPRGKDDEEVTCEWVFIDEIKVDRYDGAKRKPRSLHRKRMQTREELLERFDGDEEALDKIARVTTELPHLFRNQDSVVDMVVTTEHWHLPTGKKSGRYVETIAGETLVDEKYDDDFFPFAFFRYYNKPAGFWGRGIAETVLSAQVEINKILQFIQGGQELQCTPLILVPSNAAVDKDHLLSNLISRIVEYRSGEQPPAFVSPPGVAPEVYQHLMWWVSTGLQEIGVSATAVSGEKQAGVNSAVAMRTMVDVESSRFIQVSKNWEKFFVDCAEIVVKLAKKLYAKNDKYAVRYTDKKSKVIREIPWAKVNAPDDAFVIRCDTVSAFPQSAAGRIQTITDFIQNQFISKQRGMELLGQDPDLEGEVKLQTASLRLCEKRLCEMVEDEKYAHPEKWMDLKLALSVSQATYQQLQIDGCPEDRLELVRQWMDELCTMLGAPDPQLALLQQSFQSAQPEVAPPPQAPVGPPAMPQAA